jgi:hypothetical protein
MTKHVTALNHGFTDAWFARKAKSRTLDGRFAGVASVAQELGEARWWQTAA